MLVTITVPANAPIDASMPAAEAKAQAAVDSAKVRGGRRVTGHYEKVRAGEAGRRILHEAREIEAAAIVMPLPPKRTGASVFGRTLETVLAERPCRVIIDSPQPGPRIASRVLPDDKGAGRPADGDRRGDGGEHRGPWRRRAGAGGGAGRAVRAPRARLGCGSRGCSADEQPATRSAAAARRREARIARGLGEPALFAIILSAVGSSIYFALGVVAGEAMGLTPLVFLGAGVFFVITMLTYVEGSSLHPERGGASTFARYAFNELWSFIAGWAILLDYLIVMAIGAFAVSHYLAAFWGGAGEAGAEIVIACAAIAFVAWTNFRGISAERLRFVLRLSLVSVAVFIAIFVVGAAQLWDLALVTDSIDIGTTPEVDDLIFGAVIATVACTGIEAASGLAGEVRVGRAGAAACGDHLGDRRGRALRRDVPDRADGRAGGSEGTALGDPFIDAPVLGVVDAFDPPWLAETFRYVVGAVGDAGPARRR